MGSDCSDSMISESSHYHYANTLAISMFDCCVSVGLAAVFQRVLVAMFQSFWLL